MKSISLDENRFFDDSATALMLHGPRGSGKTSIVRAISARSPNYSLLEVNTSSERRTKVRLTTP